MSTEGKIAVVTGAGSGVGRAAALALLRTAPDGALHTHAVDRRMSSARTDDAQCIAAVKLNELDEESPETNAASSYSHQDRQGPLL